MTSKRRLGFATGLLALIVFVSCNGSMGSSPTPPAPPSPSPTPPGPLAPPSSLPYSRGVNLAGADFGENALPGVFGTNYIYLRTCSLYQRCAERENQCGLQIPAVG